MALYDYKCTGCNEVFTVEHAMSADGPSDCYCGDKLRKMFNVGGVSFKGAGFYSNDTKTESLW